jgi:hypothetical protein
VALSRDRYEQILCASPADCYQITELAGLEELAMLKRIDRECLIAKNLRGIGKKSFCSVIPLLGIKKFVY